jgi:type IV secretion system protein TrbL
MLIAAATSPPAAAPHPVPACNVPWIDEKCEAVADGLTQKAADVAGSAVSSAAGETLASLAEDFAHGAGALIKAVVTWWLQVDTPTLGGPNSPASWLQTELAWVTAFAAIAGLVVAGARIAFGGGEEAKRAGQGLGRFVVAGALAIPATSLAIEAGDLFSAWIVERTDTTRLGEGLFQLSTSSPGLSQGVVILLAIFGIVAGIVQFFLMLIRAAFLPILAGLLPTSAAASGTEQGMAAYKKHLSWLVAFVLYKPVAALIYAAAFKMLQGTNDYRFANVTTLAGSQLAGLALIMVAILTLPALLRVVAPVISQVAAGGGGAMAGAASAVLATGAVAMGGGASGAALSSGGSGTARRVSGDSGPDGGGGSAAGGGSGPGGSSAPSGGRAGSAPPGRGGQVAGTDDSGGAATPGGSGDQSGQRGAQSDPGSRSGSVSAAGSGAAGGVATAVQAGQETAQRVSDGASGAIEGDDSPAPGNGGGASGARQDPSTGGIQRGAGDQ